MEQYLISLVVCPLAALFIADYSGVVENFKYWWFYRKFTKKTKYVPFRMRPVDCPMCLSFWLAALTLLITYTSVLSILLPFASAAVAVLINAFKNKY